MHWGVFRQARFELADMGCDFLLGRVFFFPFAHHFYAAVGAEQLYFYGTDCSNGCSPVVDATVPCFAC